MRTHARHDASFLCRAMALAHLAAALVQALTIVGLGTAVTNVQMATFVV